MQRRRPHAFVFSGQGSQMSKGGFPMLDSFCSAKGAAWTVLQRADHAFRDAFGGCSLLSVMRDNPKMVTLTNTTIGATDVAEKKNFIHSNGVLNNTIFTQPALLAYQLAALHDLKEKCPALVPGNSDSTFYVAGHSAGEFTALTAMGVFDVETAIELVTRRGLAMERALDTLGLPERNAFKMVNSDPPLPYFVMVAVNPVGAQLGVEKSDTNQQPADDSAAASATAASATSDDAAEDEARSAEDVLLALIEVIARSTLSTGHAHAMLELVNDNVHQEQLVVAGDRFSCSVLGKCLDPQFRASCAENGIDTMENIVQAALFDCTADERIGVTKDPNAPAAQPFVPGSLALGRLAPIGHRMPVSPDHGATLPEDRLVRMSSIGAGRSGLKKRSFFMQLPVEVPFHSSALRFAVDEFYQHAMAALKKSKSKSISSGDAPLRSGIWIPNVTAGIPFDAAPESKFRETLLDSFATSVNVGEQAHVGRMVPGAFTKMAAAIMMTKRSKTGNAASENQCQQQNNDAEDDVLKLRAATLTAQLCHVVCWSDTMDTILASSDQNSASSKMIIEFAPSTPVLAGMFKKAAAAAAGVSSDASTTNTQRRNIELETWTLPKEADILLKTCK